MAHALEDTFGKDRVRRVLILAYWFPPDIAAGALRPWGLYRHLAGQGWAPTVVTASAGEDCQGVIRLPHPRTRGGLTSITNLAHKAPRTVIRALRGFRRVFEEAMIHPDRKAGWRRSAIAGSLEALAGGDFAALLSTSPPATAHVVARTLKERTGLPWIADLRDLWAENYAYQWSEFRRLYDRRVERRVLAEADAIITVSEPLAEALRLRHSPPVQSIPNGFPPEELAAPEQDLTDTSRSRIPGPYTRGSRIRLPCSTPCRS